MRVNKPWGYYEILANDPDLHWMVKRIVVNPGHRLSLQTHEHRSETWTFVSGLGRYYIGLKQNKLESHNAIGTVVIPPKTFHRVSCTETEDREPLVFIEVQTGYCDESDIKRYSDEYGRK